MGLALKFSKYLIKFVVNGRLRENLPFKYAMAKSKQMSKK